MAAESKMDALQAEAKKLFKEALPQVTGALKAYGKGALESLVNTGEAALKAGRDIVAKIEEVGEKVAKDEIDADSAKIATEMYFIALDNVKRGAVNATIVQEIERAKTLLGNLRDITLSVATTAAKLGVATLVAL